MSSDTASPDMFEPGWQVRSPGGIWHTLAERTHQHRHLDTWAVNGSRGGGPVRHVNYFTTHAYPVRKGMTSDA